MEYNPEQQKILWRLSQLDASLAHALYLGLAEIGRGLQQIAKAYETTLTMAKQIQEQLSQEM